MSWYWILLDINIKQDNVKLPITKLTINGEDRKLGIHDAALVSYGTAIAGSDVSLGVDSPVFKNNYVGREDPFVDYWDEGTYASVSRGRGANQSRIYFNYDADIIEIYEAGTKDDPESVVGPTIYHFLATDNALQSNYSIRLEWSDWTWVKFYSEEPLNLGDSSLFSNESDSVNFTDLKENQINILSSNNNPIFYSALNGNDRVVLPNIGEYSLTVNAVWDPTQTFFGGAGDDEITGGNGNDKIDGGADDDTIYGSTGADELFGGNGQDTFDFTNLSFATISSGTTQIINGGSHPTGGAAYLPANPDMVKLPGKPTDYDILFTGNLTKISDRTQGAPKLILNLTDVEKVSFSSSFDNSVSQNNLYAEMILLAIDAYSSSATTFDVGRNWHTLSAIELGMLPTLTGQEPLYTMVDGSYSAIVSSSVFKANADALVSVGVVSGVETLSIAFRGTDQPRDVSDWGGFKAHYAKYKPLIDAIDRYVDENGIAQVLVSGHSLGGAMVQEFMAEASHSGSKYRALTIGSPGGNSSIAGNDYRIINLSHTDDLVSDLSSGFSKDGSNIFINSDISYSIVDPLNPTPEHEKHLYLSNYLKILSFALDASTGFSQSEVADALKDGLRYDGIDVQIAVGKKDSDVVNTTAGDHYVLAGSGNETIVWDEKGSTNTRIVDGGAGDKDRVTLPGARSDWHWERDGAFFNLSHDGRDVAQLWGVEKLVFTSFFGFETEEPLPASARAPQFAASSIASEPFVAWLDGRQVSVQRPGNGATTISVDTAFDYLDTGNGNFTVMGSSSGDVIMLGTGNQTVTGGDGSDIIDGGAARIGSVLHITGGQGDDLIAGSELADSTARFAARASDYLITVRPDGSVLVIDRRDGSPEGTDQLWLVDKLQFADKTLSISQIGEEPTVESRLIAESGLTASFGGNGAIFGSQGFQDIMVYDVAGKVTFDPSFNRGGDIVRLEDPASAYTISVTGSTALLSDGDTDIEIPIGPLGVLVMFSDGGRKLYYDTSEGAVKIGTQAVRSDPATITTSTDGTALPTGSNSDAFGTLLLGPSADVVIAGNLKVYGTAEEERISLLWGGEIRFDPSFNRGGDYILMNGYASGFQAYVEASSVVIQKSDGRLEIPVGISGTTLDFHGEDNRELAYDQALRAVTLGDQLLGRDLVIITDFESFG